MLRRIHTNIKNTFYFSAEEKAEFLMDEIENLIEEVLMSFNYSEEVMLESLVHFCNTGKFLGE